MSLERLLAQDGMRTPSTRILAVSDSHSLNDLIGYLAMGAQGCVLRRQTAAELVDAIRRVSEGQVYLPNSVVGSSAASSARATPATRRVEDPLESPTFVSETHPGSLGGGIDLPQNRPLSGRQRSVMVLMARGMTNKAIARELSLAEGTVKVHVNNVFKQLNVNNRVQAIAKLAQYEFQKLGSSLLMFLSVGFTDFII
ncbi:response regulator transcription factor [Allitabrizicola rongguiensis]|uniref:response regulator transcription factor n=1 Tax=Alitabrizicola rongguiensis TaxID=2909234 RepID=UPI001F286AE0|nr:response regulator transcription factor [Tabrizicola rongguiensis]